MAMTGKILVAAEETPEDDLMAAVRRIADRIRVANPLTPPERIMSTHEGRVVVGFGCRGKHAFKSGVHVERKGKIGELSSPASCKADRGAA
ncbi:hypothetical protein Q4I28_007763 [Leishmania naiffi]|uniref:Uncharacterized protein n=1 Tax=Leishmania naiffi TaxID=5678 RepID=A0AAW3B8B6_9TRYP